MDNNGLLDSVAEQANGNSLVLFFVIVALVVIVTIPSALAYAKYKSNKDTEKIKLEMRREMEKLQMWNDREKNIMQVIKDNGEKSEKVAEALVTIATVLHTIDKTCDGCKEKNYSIWTEIKHDTQEIKQNIQELKGKHDLASQQIESGFNYLHTILKPRKPA